MGLNVKRTEVLITGLAGNFSTGGEFIEIICSFCLLGAIFNIKESTCQETPCRLMMEDWEKNLQ